LGFEHVGAGGAFGFTRADEGVEFVDKEDDFAFDGSDFLEKGLYLARQLLATDLRKIPFSRSLCVCTRN